MSATLYPFTPEMIEELKLLYPVTKNDVLAERFSCSYRKIVNMSVKYGLKKDIEWVRECSRQKMLDPNHPGRKHWKQKGDIPINKGKKQSEYMTPEAIERSKATRFQSGHEPWNTKPIGHKRITKDGYIEIKTAEPDMFELKHRVTWELHNGTIPNGYNVQFRDGDRKNCEDINNLYLISRSDQLKNENSMYAKYPKELQLAIQAKGALNRQINKLKLQENEH